MRVLPRHLLPPGFNSNDPPVTLTTAGGSTTEAAAAATALRGGARGLGHGGGRGLQSAWDARSTSSQRQPGRSAGFAVPATHAAAGLGAWCGLDHPAPLLHTLGVAVGAGVGGVVDEGCNH